VEHPYTGRNYYLFGLLTGGRVRNSDAQEWNTFYLEDKIPEDVSDYIQQQHNYWDGDAHSANYLTLKELQEWPHWDEHLPPSEFKLVHPEHIRSLSNGLIREAIIGKDLDLYVQEFETAKFRETQSVQDLSFEARLGHKVFEFADEGEFIGAIRGWSLPDWGVCHKHFCAGLYDVTIPELVELAKDKGVEPEDVRMVFWFDN